MAVCRASATPCDVAEACSPSSLDCPPDTFASSSTTCRPSAGVCDIAELCTGSSAACPADTFASSSTTCRPSAGVCDVAELCTGGSAACPVDAFVAAGTVCGAPPTDLCQLAGVCSGASGACPPPTTLPTSICESVPQASNPDTPLSFLGGLAVVGGVSITFGGPFTSDVDIEVVARDVGPPPPPGYEIIPGGSPHYWNIESTPALPGYVAPTVCIHFDPSWVTGSVCNLRFEHDAGSGFQNITSSVCDGTGHLCGSRQPCAIPDVVCGIATAHFSPFAIAQPTATPPAVTVPSNIIAEATGPTGAKVTYSASGNDPLDGPLTPQCAPASGATFPLGTTTVTCQVTDSRGLSASGSFNVTVSDTTGPVFSNLPGTITAYATSTNGAKVSYALPKATDAVDGARTVTCAPASGSQFPVNKTMVTCKASDRRGNQSTATFTVWVQYQAPGGGTFFLFPICPDGGAIFTIGRPVPVRFALTGASAGVRNLVAKFSETKTSSAILGTTPVTSDETVADSGSAFTYIPLFGFYVYRWKTADETQGTYQLRADLGDGVVHQINVSLRK